MKILFVCSMGRVRSRTAAECLKEASYDTDYCGVDLDADKCVTLAMLNEASYVICMEQAHMDLLNKYVSHKRLRCWNIPDDYAYMDDDLVHLLRIRFARFLKEELGVERY